MSKYSRFSIGFGVAIVTAGMLFAATKDSWLAELDQGVIAAGDENWGMF
jgi:hypothetical protein